jgi:hypothetical protein
MSASPGYVEGLVPFVHVRYCPDRQFSIFDPDGYCVMVTDAAAMAPPRAE